MLDKTGRPEQRVAVSHYRNEDFESGLRTYAQYRDLGVVAASNGMVRAHVLRFTEPCDPKVVSKLHFHDTEFQMVYVLKDRARSPCAREVHGRSRRASSTSSTITPRIASSWRSSCRRTLRRKKSRLK